MGYSSDPFCCLLFDGKFLTELEQDELDVIKRSLLDAIILLKESQVVIPKKEDLMSTNGFFIGLLYALSFTSIETGYYKSSFDQFSDFIPFFFDEMAKNSQKSKIESSRGEFPLGNEYDVFEILNISAVASLFLSPRTVSVELGDDSVFLGEFTFKNGILTNLRRWFRNNKMNYESTKIEIDSDNGNLVETLRAKELNEIYNGGFYCNHNEFVDFFSSPIVFKTILSDSNVYLALKSIFTAHNLTQSEGHNQKNTNIILSGKPVYVQYYREQCEPEELAYSIEVNYDGMWDALYINLKQFRDWNSSEIESMVEETLDKINNTLIDSE